PGLRKGARQRRLPARAGGGVPGPLQAGGGRDGDAARGRRRGRVPQGARRVLRAPRPRQAARFPGRRPGDAPRRRGRRREAPGRHPEPPLERREVHRARRDRALRGRARRPSGRHPRSRHGTRHRPGAPRGHLRDLPPAPSARRADEGGRARARPRASLRAHDGGGDHGREHGRIGDRVHRRPPHAPLGGDGDPVRRGGCLSMKAPSTARPRLLAALLFVGVSLLAGFGVRAGVAWVDQPFPGFFLLANHVVASVSVPGWPVAEQRELFQATLVAVDGTPVESTSEVYAYVRALPAGTPVVYTFEQRGMRVARTIESRLFGWSDAFGIFGCYLFNGLIFAVIGIGVWALSPGRSTTWALLGVGLCCSTYALTAMDLYAPHWFF